MPKTAVNSKTKKKQISPFCHVFFWPPWPPYYVFKKTNAIALIRTQSYILYSIFAQFG